LHLPSLLYVARTSTASAKVFARPKPRQQASAPQDHTPLFRMNHARAAKAETAACNFCHLGISGSTRDACQDCHAVSRPRSHTLRFRTVGHGRLAARRPKDCATCHEIEYCSECHSIAPQSHQPLASFRSNHSRVARVNARSCMTCHSFEATCEQCHSLDLTIAPRNTPSPLMRRSR
jgi:hypothetical protein